MADLASKPSDLADDSTETSVSEELPPPAVDAAATVETAAGADEPANDDLLGELARAMHVAATSQYERMNAELERRRTDQVAAIAARASADAESLKAASETDIAAIDAWAKAETEKIKHERLRRIESRREQLAAQLDRQETIKGREVFAIEVAIDAHRSEVDQFFGRMERETDPTAIARVAASMPPFPSLADVAEEARRAAMAEFEGDDVDATAAAVAAQDAGTPAAEAAASDDTSPTPDSSGKAAPADAPSGEVSETRLMAVMDPEASRGPSPDGTPPWEAPYAVSVAAGSGSTGDAAEPEPHGRVGSTLLRTVRSIRPMAGTDKDDKSH